MKTLKDLVYIKPLSSNHVVELQGVAQDWIKELKNHNESLMSYAFNFDAHKNCIICNLCAYEEYKFISWIEHFFNIGEEDIEDEQ